MKIIVGLGNPGKKYERTRHNMGFITVDTLAERYGIKIDRIRFKALTGEGQIAGQKVVLVKPQTYMNLSGESVREAVNFYKIGIEDLLVVYDDIDTATGGLRIRKKGSAGSHNGLKSVIYQLQDDGFPRIRIGIGKNDPRMDLKDYVIGKIGDQDADELKDAINRAADALEMMIAGDIDNAMNKYNLKKERKKKEEETLNG